MKEREKLVWSETDGEGLIDWIKCRKSDEGLENRLSIEAYDDPNEGRVFLISTSQDDEGFYLSKEDMIRVHNFIGKFL